MNRGPTNVGGVKTYDRITDFVDGTDKIRITDSSGNTVSATGIWTVSGGASENAVVDSIELLFGNAYTAGNDVLAFSAPGIGVGILADSNNNNIMDAADAFVWVATPGVTVTTSDFA